MNLLHDYVDGLIGGAEKRLDEAGVPKPVQIVTCPYCKGDGWRETGMNDVGVGYGHSCAYCAGRGFVATEGGEA